MESTDIIKYIESPGLLINADINYFKKLIKENPFFQSAHILLLKSLKDQNSEEFQKQLSESSVYITDRDQLFKFLNTEFKTEKKSEENIIQNIETEKQDIIENSEEKESNSKQPELLKNKNVKRKINDSIEGMGENISETISSQLEFSVIKEDDKLEYSSEVYFMERGERW
jgi:alpha-galactosidase/6-phospho-beta-glucosidase family protein